MAQKFISSAIKRPGALTAAVGGKPSKHLAMVKQLANGKGGPLKQKEASFYLQVLRKDGK
jgi:hypothetical protein